MLDELFEVFDRDGNDGRRQGQAGQQPKRGIRGFFSRLVGGGGAQNPGTAPYDEDDDDDRPERPGDRRTAKARRRDRDDGYDFDD